MVGLGVIGRVHVRVLSRVEGVRPEFLVDPRPADTAWSVPHHARLADALDDCGGEVDLVVVATPTDSHLEVAGEALAGTKATVLSEKPLTRDVAELSAFETTHAAELDRLRVVNHFAFSPEVDWGAGVVSRSGWGAPSTVFASFNDPYLLKTPVQRRSYVSSWVDSGANQLSMLARFADGWRVTRHDEDQGGLRSVTEADFDGGSATLASNWWTGDSSKQTVLRWSAGNELYLDHTAMTGFALVDGRVREHVGHDGRVDRKTAHYAAMYAALFAGSADHLLGLSLARSVADLLSSAGSQVSDDGAGPAWTTPDGTLEGWSSAHPTAGTSSSTGVAGGPPTR
jgi:predicted dehydrogenase